jgi:hypothetical protein
VLANPVSTLAISAPASSLVTSQKVLFFARAVTLADGSRLLAVAEVQLSLLATIMTQGAGIRGLEVTLERDAGPLLASLPPRDDLIGRQIEPPLREQTSDGRPSRMAARLSGLPAIVVARPTLHRNLLIVASIPLTAALQDWRRERDLIAWTAAAIGLMILAVALLHAVPAAPPMARADGAGALQGHARPGAGVDDRRLHPARRRQPRAHLEPPLRRDVSRGPSR